MTYRKKCNGCHAKIYYKDEFERSNFSEWHKKQLHREYGYGKWNWICRYPSSGRRTFRNCPCSRCLLKPTCTELCTEMEFLVYGPRSEEEEKYGSPII